MITFSIIIPHKNIPSLLSRCIDSIPDTDDIQVIIVDDNSDPNVVDFNNFPGKDRSNVITIFDKIGGGAGHARNIALKHADGKWLVFADSDDFFAEGAFEHFREYQNNSSQIILFKQNSFFSDTLEPSDRCLKHNKNVDLALQNIITPKEAILNEPGPTAKMFLRDHITKNNIEFEEVIASNDVMFVVKATCWAENVIATPYHVFCITQRRGSLTDRTMGDPKNYLCRLEVKIRRNKFYKDYPYQKSPILGLVLRAVKFGPITFLKAIWIAIKTGSLFSGFGVFLKKVWQKTFGRKSD